MVLNAQIRYSHSKRQRLFQAIAQAVLMKNSNTIEFLPSLVELSASDATFKQPHQML